MTVVITVLPDEGTKVTVSDGDYQRNITLTGGQYLTLTGASPRVVGEPAPEGKE